MDFIKKQTVATWITLGTVILTIVALVLCGNNSSEGYFAALLNQGNWMSLLVWSLVLEIIYLVLVQVNVEGVAGTAVKFVGDVLKIVIAVLARQRFGRFPRYENRRTRIYSLPRRDRSSRSSDGGQYGFRKRCDYGNDYDRCGLAGGACRFLLR